MYIYIYIYTYINIQPEDWGPPADAVAQHEAQFGLLEAPRRAQKIEINYARTAKKVRGLGVCVDVCGYGCGCGCVKIEIEYARTARKVRGEGSGSGYV